MLESELRDAWTELNSALTRYNDLLYRLNEYDQIKGLAILIKDDQYDLETEVMKEADHKSCVKSASRTYSRSSKCSTEKLCHFCKWNERRDRALKGREMREKILHERATEAQSPNLVG